MTDTERLEALERDQLELTRQFVELVKDVGELNKIMRAWSANYPPLGRITKTLQLRAQRLALQAESGAEEVAQAIALVTSERGG